MANQVVVTQSGNVQVNIQATPNVQVQVSRAAIGNITVSNVAVANSANYAGNVTVAAQPNITSLGTLTGLTSSGNITAPFFLGNVVGNISGNIVVPGTNTSVLFNQLGNAGASDAFQFNYATNVATITGNLSATNISGNGAGLSAITGANVTGQVSYAAVANSVSGSNVSGEVSYAQTANSVAGGNVSGQVAYAAVANSVAGANVTGQVSYAAVANSVAGANVSGTVANATHAVSADSATVANSANSVAVGNVVGIGNIATVNLTGSSSNVLYGNGVFAPAAGGGDANYANFAGNAFSVSGSNVSGAVNLANFATTANAVAGANVSGQVSYAAVANSVAGANVSGDVSGANHANVADSANSVAGGNVVGQVANSLVAGTVYTNAQPNITSVGTLTSLAVAGNITGVDVLSFDTSNGTGTLTTGQMSWDVTERTMSLGMLNGVTQQIGLETYVVVKASSAITDGQVVMFAGASGDNVLAAPADVTSVGFQTEYVIGVATQSIATNDFGYITVFGQVHGLNTNGFNVGDILWLSTSTPGALTSTQPTDPNFQIQVAAVTKKSVGDGHIQVRLTPYWALSKLTDVDITTPTTGQALVYNGSNVWINGNPNLANYASVANSVAVANVSGIGNIATVNLDGNSGNVLYGNGVFAGISATSANFANYAGNVTVAAQANITSLGNLTSVTVRDGNVSNPIMAVTPTSNVIGVNTFSNAFISVTNYSDLGNANSVQNLAFVKSRGNVTVPAAAANNDVIMRVASHVYNGNTYPKAVQIQTIAPQAANANMQLANTVWTPGQFQVIVGNPLGNVSNSSSNTNQNLLNYNQNGSLVLITGTNSGGTPVPAINMITYGVAANGVGGVAPVFYQRARGNRDSNVAVGTGDTLGSYGFQGYNGNAFFSTRFASISAVVNTAHGAIANGASIPTDLSFVTTSNTTSYTTTLSGNGAATFPGLVTVTGNVTAGNITTGKLNGSNSVTITMDNISTVNPSFAFSTYNNSNTLVNPYTFFRSRGTVASPAPVQAGDSVSSIGYNVYGDSGNTYLSVASSSVNVIANDGAGNVTADYSITANKISLVGNVYPTNVVFNKFNETVVSGGSISGTITPNAAAGTIYTYTLTGSITLNSLANAVAGTSMTLIVTQGGTGSYTLTSSMKFAGGTKTLSTAVGAVDIISVFYDGSTYYASLTTGYA